MFPVEVDVDAELDVDVDSKVLDLDVACPGIPCAKSGPDADRVEVADEDAEPGRAPSELVVAIDVPVPGGLGPYAYSAA